MISFGKVAVNSFGLVGCGEFFKEHIAKESSAKNALLALGSEGRRQVRARLITMHYDTLEQELTKAVLSFEDLVLLDDRDLQRVLREVDNGELARALKGASYDVKEKVFRNMSRRAATMLKEDIEYMGAVRKGHVYEAQDKILAVVRRLDQSEEFVIVRPGEADEFVG